MIIFWLLLNIQEIIAEQVHQGKVCGEQTSFVLGAKSQVVKSPFYPASFSSQIQCVWSVKALNPSSRIKVEFQDWIIPASGKGCDQTYLQITDGSGDVDHATGKAQATGSVKLCGRNPGFIVTHNSELSLLLHGDSTGDGLSLMSPVQRFRLIISTTQDAPRMLDYNGHSIANGRPKSVDAKSAAPPSRVMQRTYPPTVVRPRNFPAYGHQSPAAAHPGMIANGGKPPRIHAEFQGAIHGGSNINARPTQQSFTTARISNDSGSSNKIATQVGNIGIILLLLAILLFAILAIVYLRKKRAKKEENNEKSDEK